MLQKERKYRPESPRTAPEAKLRQKPERPVTLAELARRLHTSRSELLRWMDEGKVKVSPRKTQRGDYLFTTADVHEFKRHHLVSQLPDWCNVYEGLTDEEIADVESIALDRSRFTRPPDA